MSERICWYTSKPCDAKTCDGCWVALTNSSVTTSSGDYK